MAATAQCEVTVSIAVSDTGRVTCHVANSNWITEQRSYEAWLRELRESKLFWSIKTVKVHVPMPLQYEDMTSAVQEPQTN